MTARAMIRVIELKKILVNVVVMILPVRTDGIRFNTEEMAAITIMIFPKICHHPCVVHSNYIM